MTTVLMPLRSNIVGEVQRPLLVLLGAIALVLLIACANLTNFARTCVVSYARTRVAPMPRREHVADSQQTLTESLLLSFLGALLGILIAIWIVTALKSLVGSQIPHVESAGIDATVLLFTTAVMLLTGALCGLAPALRSARINLQEAIKDGTRSSASGSPAVE